jgi:MYXO-CTERM domain-containing protein
MKPSERRFGGWRSLARTAGLLVALAGATGFGAQGCSGGEEAGETQATAADALIIGMCDDSSASCPEHLTGTCGLLYCETRSSCAFKASQDAGEKCETDAGEQGACVPTATAGRVSFLTCCTGCIDRDGTCRPGGNTDAFCGGVGDRCDTCGTCSVCKEGACVDEGDGSACTNGNAGRCLSGTCCTGCIKTGVCYLNAVDNCGRSGGACTDCDDDKPCTNDTCSAGTCGHTNIPGACNPGNECITGASCSGSTCTGQAKVCDDNNQCTTDSCDPATGCETTPLNSGTCNDGNACTSADSCANGTCRGTAVTCNDNNPCTTDSCDSDTGCVFTNLPEGDACNDGNSCSSGDRCTDADSDGTRTCEPVSGLNCVDNNPCTSDVGDCSGEGSCPHTPVAGPCSTGDLCKVGQTCDNGTCGGGTDINCDDDNPCTVDSCDPAVGCVRTPQGGECNDGNPCTVDDACNADDGTCGGTDVTCTAAGECYLPGECSETTGTCSDLRKPNGTECGTTGTCQTGVCEGDGVVSGEGGGTGSAGEGNGPGGAGEGSGGSAGDGNGTSGSSPGAGEGGTSPGSAGNDGASGNATNGGEGNGATGGSGNGAAPGDAGQGSSGEVYVRDPGGCSCSVPGTSERSGRAFGVLGLALGLAYAARRRRYATS